MGKEMIAGYLVWRKGLKGFVAEKHPASYQPPRDEPPPVDRYELGTDVYQMSILILEQRFPVRAKIEDEVKS